VRSVVVDANVLVSLLTARNEPQRQVATALKDLGVAAYW
jgi:hypothetical protein